MRLPWSCSRPALGTLETLVVTLQFVPAPPPEPSGVTLAVLSLLGRVRTPRARGDGLFCPLDGSVVVYSLNVPLPGAVSALASSLARDLPAARARTRHDHALVVKRLGGDQETLARLAARARDALAGAPAFEARVTGIDCFADAATGPSPVVYLAVESPGLVGIHHRLVETFDPVAGLEAGSYVPHVTIARGGTVDAARRLADRPIDPVEWTVDELVFRDAGRGRTAGTVSLPA
jgi:2'-5' RNA ligase